MKITSLCAAALLAVSAATVAATPSQADVQWIVSGTFSDGGTLSGHFTLNKYGYLENNFDLVTTGGGTLAGFDYNASNSYFSSGKLVFDAAPGYQSDLHLAFTESLLFSSKNNSLVDVGAKPSFECTGSYSCPTGGETRYFVSGAASAVPEPSTWAMLLLGFAGVGFAGYRRATGKQIIEA